MVQKSLTNYSVSAENCASRLPRLIYLAPRPSESDNQRLALSGRTAAFDAVGEFFILPRDVDQFAAQVGGAQTNGCQTQQTRSLVVLSGARSEKQRCDCASTAESGSWRRILLEPQDQLAGLTVLKQSNMAPISACSRPRRFGIGKRCIQR